MATNRSFLPKLSKIVRLSNLNPGFDQPMLMDLQVSSSVTLLGLIKQAIQAKSSFYIFRTEVIKILLPQQTLHQSLAQWVYRPQRWDENFEDFVCNICNLADLL